MAKNDETTELMVPPELAKQLAEAAQEEAALERTALPNVSLRSGVMSYLDTPVEGNTMDVIVVGFSFIRTLYLSRFDSDEITPPDCYALSLNGQNMMPPEDYGYGLDCENCPNNKWGSDVRDGKPSKGKRCKERRRLIIAPASVLKKGTTKDAELAMLTVPVTSVKNWGTYVNKLKSGLARPVWSVITNLKLVPDTKTQIQLKFEYVEPINDPKLLGELGELNKEVQLYTMQGFDMSGNAGDQEPPPDSDKL